MTHPVAMTYARSIRWASAAAAGAIAPTARVGSRFHSAASNGRMPRTDWRYWVKNTAQPTMANIAIRFISTETLYARCRSSPRSSIGWRAVRCRWTNPAPAARPTTTAATGSAATPLRAISLTP